jgi:hypothetical protein
MKFFANVGVMGSMLALAVLVLPMVILLAAWVMAEGGRRWKAKWAFLASLSLARAGVLRVPGPLDDNQLLQDTVTKTASFDSAAFDLGAGFDPESIGMPVAGVIQVTAGDRADSNETYTFKLQESADGSTNWTDIGVTTAVTVATTVFTTGTYVVKGFASKQFVRLSLAIAGTTPSITYKAWFRAFRLAV